MDSREIFNHFKNILDNLITNSNFWATYVQNPCYVNVGDVYWEDGYGVPTNISLHTGASRGCIVDENYDWVVKFDTEDDYYGAACEREVNTYEAAKTRDLSRYFTPAIYLGTYTYTFNFYKYYRVYQWASVDYYDAEEFADDFNNHSDEFGPIEEITIEIPLYAYRKVDSYSHASYYSMNNGSTREFVRRSPSPLSERNYNIACDFVDMYGEEEYLRLAQFLKEMKINDLHMDNIGFEDDRMVLLDYAGYYNPEDYCEEDEEWEDDEEDD